MELIKVVYKGYNGDIGMFTDEMESVINFINNYGVKVIDLRRV